MSQSRFLKDLVAHRGLAWNRSRFRLYGSIPINGSRGWKAAPTEFIIEVCCKLHANPRWTLKVTGVASCTVNICLYLACKSGSFWHPGHFHFWTYQQFTDVVHYHNHWSLIIGRRLFGY